MNRGMTQWTPSSCGSFKGAAHLQVDDTAARRPLHEGDKLALSVLPRALRYKSRSSWNAEESTDSQRFKKKKKKSLSLNINPDETAEVFPQQLPTSAWRASRDSAADSHIKSHLIKAGMLLIRPATLEADIAGPPELLAWADGILGLTFA